MGGCTQGRTDVRTPALTYTISSCFLDDLRGPENGFGVLCNEKHDTSKRIFTDHLRNKFNFWFVHGL